MRVSVIIPIRQSLEVFRRQILYLNSLGLPDDFEIIIVDHANEDGNLYQLGWLAEFNIRYCRYNDPSPWPMASLFNLGRERCRGEYIQVLGIDHMLSPNWIEWAKKSRADYAVMRRRYAYLDESGNLILCPTSPRGLDPYNDNSHIKPRLREPIYSRASLPPLVRIFSAHGWMSVSMFDKLGGYDEKFNGRGREDIDIRRRYNETGGKVILGPVIYMYPEKGDPHRPKELFHDFPDHLGRE